MMEGVLGGDDGGCSGTSLARIVVVGGYGMIPVISLAGCGANVLFLVLR